MVRSTSNAVLLLALAATQLLVGVCAARAADPPRVLATLKPVHSLVAEVMQGAGMPELLLDGAASPHGYALKPSEARRLQAADVVIRVSEGLETFLVKTLAQLPQTVKVVTLDRVDGLLRLPLRGGGAFEDDGHGHGGGHGSAHATANGIDPHIWLDPANARLIAGAIAAELGRIAPARSERYRVNAKSLAERLERLSASLAADMKPLAGRPFLVFHDAYQYFEHRFAMTAAGSVTVSPEVPPSARRLRQLRGRILSDGVVCVFAEPQFPPRIIETIIEGTPARRGTLDPLGVALPAGPGMYAALLEGLARDMKSCLGEPS